MTRLVIGIQPRHHRHTPKKVSTTQCTKQGQANTPTQQKYIGTLSSSQTTPAHPNQPTHSGPVRSDFGIYQRLFSCPPHKPERISPSSGALSVSLTRYKLHTPHTQHKPAAHKPFFTCSYVLVWGSNSHPNTPPAWLHRPATALPQRQGGKRFHRP